MSDAVSRQALVLAIKAAKLAEAYGEKAATEVQNLRLRKNLMAAATRVARERRAFERALAEIPEEST